MDPLALFGISVLFGFAAWGVVTARYLWPKLRSLPREQALAALLTLHAFRFIGLSFLMPGVVRSDLSCIRSSCCVRRPDRGDLGVPRPGCSTHFLGPRCGLALQHLGTCDLVYAFYNGLIGVRPPPGSMGVAFFIPTAIVPLLFLTHGMMFRLLLGARSERRAA